jgi:hypothetical protein
MTNNTFSYWDGTPIHWWYGGPTHYVPQPCNCKCQCCKCCDCGCGHYYSSQWSYPSGPFLEHKVKYES